MDAKQTLEELRNKGKKIYSFSKLGSFYNCEHEYYNTYILRKKGLDNIYTGLGSTIHDAIEHIYKGEWDENDLQKQYYDKLTESEMLGLNFPNEKIADSWKADVGHFAHNFNKIDKKAILEKLVVFEVESNEGEKYYLQGYIDAIFPSDKGKPYIDIVDWKTSSKFAGEKLKEAGRQLLMYKLALESTTSLKVDKVMWFMIKYLYVCHKQKNSKIKKKMCNRGKWVKEMESAFKKDMKKLEMDDFEIEMLIDNAIQANSIDVLPQEIKNKYWLEDCFVEYEITDENIEELKQYITSTIKEIESKNPDNEDEWEGIEINKYNSFYCSVLCGHRKHCKYYKSFLEENADSFKKDKKLNGLDDLFS